MLNKQTPTNEKLREYFYEKGSVMEAAIDKITEFRGEVVEKIGFAPLFVVQQKTERFMPRFDLFDSGDAYQLDIELPGLSADDIQLAASRDSVRVSGTRRKHDHAGKEVHEVTAKTLFLEQMDGDFSRTLHLDTAIDKLQCKARLGNGILHVSLPKVADQANEEAAEEISIEILTR